MTARTLRDTVAGRTLRFGGAKAALWHWCKNLALVPLLFAARRNWPIAPLVAGTGTVAGLLEFAAHLPRWQSIRRAFATSLGWPWHKIPGYFVARNCRRLWGICCFEHAAYLRSRVSFEGLDSVRQALQARRGVIVVGMHANPSGLLILGLSQLDAGIAMLVNRENTSYLGRDGAFSDRAGLPKKISFLRQHALFLEAGRQERHWVRFALRGGISIVKIDFHLPSKPSEMSFLEGRYRFSTFPFKVALRHNLPLFIATVGRHENRQKITFIPLPSGKSPEEHLAWYCAKTAESVLLDPAGWLFSHQMAHWRQNPVVSPSCQ